MTDMINNPSHYQTDNGLDANTVQKAFFADDPWYWTVFKYMARETKKGTPEQDARKGLWYYIDRLNHKYGTNLVALELPKVAKLINDDGKHIELRKLGDKLALDVWDELFPGDGISLYFDSKGIDELIAYLLDAKQKLDDKK